MAGKTREYRIDMPLKLEEYNIGQLFSFMEIAKLETGGNEGVEIVTNEPFEGVIEAMGDGKTYKGQFTKKIIYLQSKVPRFIRLLAPKGSLEIIEDSWNFFPMTCTVYCNPDYMKDKFHIIVKSFYDDSGKDLENATNLTTEQLGKREVIDLNILSTPIEPRDYAESEDPSKFHSQTTGRGPLQQGWETNHTPLMRVYKSYDIQFVWFGLQEKVEKIIIRSVTRLLTRSYRRVFCWLDKWHNMTIADIRKYEDEAKNELDSLRNNGIVRGMVEK